MGEFSNKGYIPTPFTEYLKTMYDTLHGVNPDLFPDLNSKPDDSTIDAVKCRIDAEIFARLDQQLAANINNMDLNFARGSALDALGVLQNSFRKLASATSVTLTFTGLAGTVIPALSKFRGSGFTFVTHADNTIPTGATTVDGTAVCTVAGDNVPTEVNEIVNGLPGLKSVALKAVDKEGSPQQGDPNFRVQIKEAAFGSAHGLAESVNASILKVPEILDVRVYNNGLTTPDTVTAQPPHSILMVVYINNNVLDPNLRTLAEIVADVWKHIYLVNSTGVLQFTAIPKLPPAQIHNNPNFPTPGFPQQTTPIAFVQPTQILIHINIQLYSTPEFPYDWRRIVARNVFKYSNGELELNQALEGKVFKIGVDVTVQEWTVPVLYTIIKWGGRIKSIDVSGQKDVLPINFYSVPFLRYVDITVSGGPPV